MEEAAGTQQLASEFGSLCNKPAFSDVRFIFGTENTADHNDNEEGVVIYGHKAILAARSQVFSTMFQSDPCNGKLVMDNCNCGGNTNIYKIADIKPEIFVLIMQYIYSATLNTQHFTIGIALDILYAAKKYMLNGLADKCESYLNMNMEPANIHLILNSLHLFSKSFIYRLDNLIQLKTAEILRNPFLMGIDENGIYYIAQQETLQTLEVELFVFLISWAKEKCERQDLVVNRENIRQVLGRTFDLIRFHSMTSIEFVQKVIPEGILTLEEEVCIFRAIANGGGATLPSVCDISIINRPMYSRRNNGDGSSSDNPKYIVPTTRARFL